MDPSLQLVLGFGSWCGLFQALTTSGPGIITALLDGPISLGQTGKSVQKKELRQIFIKARILPQKRPERMNYLVSLILKCLCNCGGTGSDGSHILAEDLLTEFCWTSEDFHSQIWPVQETRIYSGCTCVNWIIATSRIYLCLLLQGQNLQIFRNTNYFSSDEDPIIIKQIKTLIMAGCKCLKSYSIVFRELV